MNWTYNWLASNPSINWLNVAGLAIEIAGLAFLFFDLLRSKSRDKGAEAISAFQENLEAGGRELIIRTYENFSTVVKAVSQLLELDMDQAIPKELRTKLVLSFQQAATGLKTEEEMKEIHIRELVAKAGILQSFQNQVTMANSLRRIATIGIAFVLAGASLQLASLFFSATL